VFVRYVLNAPTTWAFDFSYITYGAMFLMAGAYTLSRNGHVRADVVYRLWKPRTQATVDLVLYIIFFLPAVLAFIYSGWNYAAMSIRFREVSIFSPAGVPVFPLKTLTPIVGVLLLLQGIAEIIRCVLCIRLGQWPQRLHDVEETESIILQEQRLHAAEQAEQPQSGQKGT
jgi:TRAP-type mannitol/chloroaromatic compound transport system permease small subunit